MPARRGGRGRSYKHVERILKLGFDLAPAPDDDAHEDARPIDHDQVRGPDYYLH